MAPLEGPLVPIIAALRRDALRTEERHICSASSSGLRPFVRQRVARQFAVRCKLLDEREPVITE